MADIAAEAGLTVELSFLEGASRACFYLWQTAWNHASNTIAGDADALHDMRVALRRLRSALQNFEGNTEVELVSPSLRKEMKEQRRKLGKLGDALGAVRDYDVLDDYLKDYAKAQLKVPLEQSEGLAHFEQFLQSERAKNFEPMVEKLNRAAEPTRLQEQFGRWALGLPAASGPHLSFGEAAHKVLSLRLNDVVHHAPALQQDEDSEAHHELRKALRRLRYTLEIFAPCYGKPVKSYVKVLVQLQDGLGEMQDRAVLHETALRAFPQKSHKSTLIPEDVQQFVEYGTQRHEELLHEVRRLWNTQEQSGFWGQLRAL